MDYKRELFAQCTPYLQWLKDKECIQNSDIEAIGEPICVFPFSSCTDSVSAVLGTSIVNREAIYLFANEDGVLRDGAPARIAQVFGAHQETLVVYADEDYYGTLEELYQIDEHMFEDAVTSEFKEPANGLFRGEPWYKPEFSPDTLEAFFYIGNLFALKGQVIADITDEFGADVPLCALVRIISRKTAASHDTMHGTEVFVHIPEVLYTNNRLSKRDELDCFEQNDFEKGATKRLGGKRAKLGRLSVIIPSKDNPQILKRCIGTFRQCAKDMDYELIVVDNGSTDGNCMCITAFLEECGAKYLYEKAEFNFSRMCNRGAAAADGDFLLFLNDDIEAGSSQRDGQWLAKMMRYAAMEHVGAVGMKLCYPDSDLIQHVGITNMGIGPAHKLGGMPDRGNLYHGHNLADYDMLAVTAACMMVSRRKFERAGGFDEELAVAYNDVELCFRLYKMGLYNVQVNSAFLIHHESLSRGQDTAPEKQARLLREKQKLYEKHPWASPKAQTPDPFYSPNLVQWEKDAAYHVNYQYAFDRAVKLKHIPEKEKRRMFQREEFRSKLKKTNAYIFWLYDKLTRTDRHMLHIDGITQEEGIVTVTGWHVLRKQNNAKLVKRLWIYDSQGAYEAALSQKLRRDVEALFAQGTDHTQNTALSGFRLKFEAACLPKGRYSIGIVVEKKGRRHLVCSTEQFDLQTWNEMEKTELERNC